MKRERKFHHQITSCPSPSGHIFICDCVTKPEFFQYAVFGFPMSRIFGFPMSRIDTVMSIEPGTPLLLFDCSFVAFGGSCSGQIPDR